jgi:magnesium-transporting ATPase (P-type)
LNEEILNQMSDQIKAFAKKSLRTMLFAYNDLGAQISKELKDPSSVEKDLIVCFIVGIADPLRPEVIVAIQN